MTRSVATWLMVAVLAAPALTRAGEPDLTGVWLIVKPPTTLKTVAGARPPLNPSGAALYEQHLAAAAHGDRTFDGTGKCLPPGLPRLMLVNEPFEIMQRDKAVYFLHELNRLPRRAYFGEALPADADPMYLGYSVARWDGATLVIESAGFREGTLLDYSGLPHSESLHLTERYQLDKDGRTLHARFTIDDPKMFTRPWDAKADYVRRPGYEIPEQVCADTQPPNHGE
ncbi:MAG TPA: hypothetical protein VH209_17340 [Steroidobacteraceae bacterium]|nr:hypothetical protein [Steroidobacteraceae bacterium]